MVKCRLGIARVARSRRVPGQPPKKAKLTYNCFVEGCERQFSIRSYLGKHLEKDHNLTFESFETTCHICQEVSATLGEHMLHVKTHSCNFSCEICKQKYKTEKALQNHMETKHNGEDRPFICQEINCGARFKRAAHLKSHHMFKHSDERNFGCELCPKKYFTRSELNAHIR